MSSVVSLILEDFLASAVSDSTVSGMIALLSGELFGLKGTYDEDGDFFMLIFEYWKLSNEIDVGSFDFSSKDLFGDDG